MMSRKHYKAIAAVIKENVDAFDNAGYIAARNIGNSIADICAEDNPNFNRAKFLQACGIKS